MRVEWRQTEVQLPVVIRVTGVTGQPEDGPGAACRCELVRLGGDNHHSAAHNFIIAVQGVLMDPTKALTVGICTGNIQLSMAELESARLHNE